MAVPRCRAAAQGEGTHLHPWTGHISLPIQHRHPGGTGTKHNLIEFYSTSGLVTKTQLSARLPERPVRDYAFFNCISKCSAWNESRTHAACGLSLLLTFKALPFASDTRKRSEESQYCLSPFLAWCFLRLYETQDAGSLLACEKLCGGWRNYVQPCDAQSTFKRVAWGPLFLNNTRSDMRY